MMKPFRLPLLVVIAFSSITIISCNKHPHQNVPQNNWSEEDKRLVLKHIHRYVDISPLPEIAHNADEIAQRTLNDCIISFPDITDFNKHDLFETAEAASMSKIMAEYIKH